MPCNKTGNNPLNFPGKNPVKPKFNHKKPALLFYLSLIALMFLFPLLCTLLHSFARVKQAAGISVIDGFSIYQYQSVLSVPSWFFAFFKNSMILVFPVVLGQTAVALPAAYAFSRLRSGLSDSIFFIYVVALMMPFMVSLVPNYIIIEKLGLLTKYSSVILPGVFGAFGVFLLKQFMQHIPVEYLEAAEIMGASQFVVLIKIVIPLIKNGIAALIALLFIDNWSMVEQPLIFLQDMDKFPISIFLSNNEILMQDDVFAAAVLSMLPALAVFLLCEKHLVRGICMSSVKKP